MHATLRVLHTAPLLVMLACDSPAAPLDQAPPPYQLTLISPTYAIRGRTLRLEVRGALPSSTVGAFGSTSTSGRAACPPQLGGRCLDLRAPAVLLGVETAGPTGTATILVAVPTNAAASRVSVQAAGGGFPSTTTQATLLILNAADDEDGDGLRNDAEYTAATDPFAADTDGDRISDGDEVAQGTNPLRPNLDVSRVMFLGSMDTDGRLGFPAGVDDDYCQLLADWAFLDGRYVALVSTDLASARQRLDDAPLVREDGLLVASGPDDLFDGALRNPISMDEYGATTATWVYTGTAVDGSTVTDGHCDRWSAATGGASASGWSGATDGAWTLSSETRGCGAPQRLYCVQVTDSDGDRLSDADEAWRGTNPAVPDTDGDGHTDGAEVYTLRTDPLAP